MHVDVSGYLLAMPCRCACCGSTPDTQLTVGATKTRGKRVRHTQTRTWAFPYCGYCVGHIGAAESARTFTRVLAVLSIFTGILVGSYTQPATGITAAILALIGTIITGFACSSRARARCKPTCASVDQAISYLGWHGTLHRFEIQSADFTRDFVTVNEKKVVNLSPSVRTLLASSIPSQPGSPHPMPSSDDRVAVETANAFQKQLGRQPRKHIPIIPVSTVVFITLVGVFYWKTQQPETRKSALITDNPKGAIIRGSYKTYYNQRFGFRIAYPASFRQGEAPTDGDGITFASPTGDAELTTAGGYNSGSTLQDLFRMSLQRLRAPVRYNRIGGNWFVISWDDGRTIGYTKMFVGGQSHNFFTFTYQKGQAPEYNRVVAHLEASFRPGNLESAQASENQFTPTIKGPNNEIDTPNPRIAIARALKGDEDAFCSETQTADCREQFLKGLNYKSIVLTPNGRPGLIVELCLRGFEGSGGCDVEVLRATEGGYETVLNEVGGLAEWETAATTTNGYYDLVQHHATATETRDYSFIWMGSRYDPRPPSASPPQLE